MLTLSVSRQLKAAVSSLVTILAYLALFMFLVRKLLRWLLEADHLPPQLEKVV